MAFPIDGKSMGFGNTPGKSKTLNNGTLGNATNQFGYPEKNGARRCCRQSKIRPDPDRCQIIPKNLVQNIGIAFVKGFWMNKYQL